MAAMNSGEESPNTMRESGFRANLHGASLADLVQMECLSGRERVMRVSSGGKSLRRSLGGGGSSRSTAAMVDIGESPGNARRPVASS